MIMIITPSRAYPFRLDEWGRDNTRDVHVYDGGNTVATFDGDSVEAVFQNLTESGYNALCESIDVDVADAIGPENQTTGDSTTTT